MAIDWLAAAAWTAVLASGTTASVQHNRQKRAVRRQRKESRRIATTANIDRVNEIGRGHLAQRGIRQRQNFLSTPLLPHIGY